MKAAVLVRPGLLQTREVPDPVCSSGGAVVKILACNICSADLHMWRIGHPALRCPRILGHEITGVVVEVSEDSTDLSVGDRVQVYPGLPCTTCNFCRQGRENLCPSLGIIGFNVDGGFAQYISLPKRVAKVLNRIPPSLSFAEAALAEPLACCLNGLERASLNPGDTVLILGAGPMGCLFALASRHLGAGKVILVENDSTRRNLCKGVRAEALLDPSETETVKAVLDLTNGNGADIVVGCFREAAVDYSLLELAAPSGRVLMFSGLSGNGVVPTDLNRVHYAELGLVGAYGCTAAQCRRALHLLQNGLEAGWLISLHVSLDSLKDGLDAVASKKVMKVCVRPWEDENE